MRTALLCLLFALCSASESISATKTIGAWTVYLFSSERQERLKDDLKLGEVGKPRMRKYTGYTVRAERKENGEHVQSTVTLKVDARTREDVSALWVKEFTKYATRDEVTESVVHIRKTFEE